MKNRTVKVAVIVCGLVLSSNAIATGGGKTKPPVAEPTVTVSWYESVLDYFGF